MRNKRADRRHRLLIVDDDEAFCLLLKEELTSLGYYCKTAFSGESALEIIQSSLFDALITDIAMPGMDGFELCERLKQKGSGLPIIVMSAFPWADLHDRATAAGASDHLEKPFAIDDLVKAIDRTNSSPKSSPR